MCNIADPGGVTLFVQTAEFNVLEPVLGQSVVVTGCFFTNITQMRSTDDVFEFTLLNSSMATDGLDFFVNSSSPFITIPATFTGIYFECVDIEIFGDNITEGNELIEYSLQPLSSEDTVQYPPGSDSIRISIFDDGMSCTAS